MTQHASPRAAPAPSLTAADRQRLMAWLDQAEGRLTQRRDSLQAQAAALAAELGQAGLDSPEAIQAWYDGMDASDRLALERQLQAQEPAPAGEPARRAKVRRFL